MMAEDWSPAEGAEGLSTVGMLLAGDAVDAIDAEGNPETGDTFLVVLHMGDRPVTMRLPEVGSRFEVVIDTVSWEKRSESFAPGSAIELSPLRALVLRSFG
jgi:hypothetical protein